MKKYKNTVVKLHSPTRCVEILGWLEEVYDNNYLKLRKPIITADKTYFNYSGVMSEIIKLEYVNAVENTLTIPLAPNYNNDNTSQVVLINIQNFIFIPLYENKINNIPENLINMKEDLKLINSVKNIISKYIDYIYETYYKVADFIKTDNTTLN